jgi:hypothetical protein
LKKDQGEHWGSGGYAVLLAAVLGHQEVTMIGFDSASAALSMR